MRRRISIILMTSLVLSIIGCKKEQPKTDDSARDEEVKVFTSNYPLSYFAERISGKSEILIFPEIAGDPAFWEPTFADIIRMEQSDIIIINGAAYE